jgi:hypothetical protein
VDDILANNPEHSVMLPQILDGSGKSTLRNLTTAYPTLGLNSDDAVYLMSKVECNDNVVWMVGVDLGSNTVELLEPYCAERASYFIPDCVPWAFSEFLNPTPRHVFNQTSFVFQLSIGYLIFHRCYLTCLLPWYLLKGHVLRKLLLHQMRLRSVW